VSNDRLEPFVRKLKQQTRLSNASVSNDDVPVIKTGFLLCVVSAGGFLKNLT
jgi:hypothetical protein